ncbi:sensor histidine kinase [Schinkia azotoformans]|nr:sensor histidine kinase [Schinkia azotoformans]
MKEDFGYIFRQKLFYEKHNLQASLHQFAHHLSKSMKKDDIETHIKNEINSVLKVTNAKIIEYDKQTNTLLTEENEQIFKEIIKQKMPTGELRSAGDMYLVFIGGNSEKEYFLCFSGKKNNTKLNLNEREWLKTISYLINLAIENLQLVEGLIHNIEDLRDKNKAPSWVLRLLFNIQEQERKKFSTDLHDSALQTQLMWYRKLETYLDEHALTAVQKQELDEIKEGFMDVIYDIRQTCFEMLPPFLKDFGLKKALKDLVDISQTRYLFLIDLDTANLQENLDDDTVLILYRVAQELLNNAAKHSRANHIKIRLETLVDVTILSYKDNGSGFEKDIKKNNFGLSGISERVRSVEGQMELKTEVGQGVEITIKIPACGYLTGEEVDEHDKGFIGG